jgi:hypothetical protein
LNDSGLRNPSWLDVITLALVVAALVACYQCGWLRMSTKTRVFLPQGNILIDGLHEFRHILTNAMPVVLGLAVVGFARVLREPRPARVLLFRQPGVAACAAMVAALITAGANTGLWVVRWVEFREEWLSRGFPVSVLFDIAARHVSFCVIAVWVYLAIGGMWAPGRNWVNWLGGTLGVLSVLNAFLWCLP